MVVAEEVCKIRMCGVNPSGPGLLCNFGPLEQDCQDIKGAHSLLRFLLRKCRFGEHHAGAMPQIFNWLGTFVWYIKGFFALSFSPDALVTSYSWY